MSRHVLRFVATVCVLTAAAHAVAQTTQLEPAAPPPASTPLEPAPATPASSPLEPKVEPAQPLAASAEPTTVAEAPPDPAPQIVGGVELADSPDASSDMLSDSELAELGLSGDLDEVPIDTDLRLYGFIDFSTQFVLGSEDWRAVQQRYPSFFIGNFNLYVTKNLTESFRTFAEVRLMYLPHGARDFTTTTENRTSTSVPDYAELDRPLRWGGIEIERVYLDWMISSWITLRVGQFLTPYGIWNVDHGSPTIIPVARPFIIGQQLFPERQTGFELLGSTSLSAHQTLGYHLTLSNGMGPVSEYRDLDANKAIGGRVYWRLDSFGELRIGASAFWGRDTDALEVAFLRERERIGRNERILSQSDVLSLAADVQWKYENFLLQAELNTQQRAFTDEGRGGATHPLVGIYVSPKDSFARGGYVLLGYRIEWFGIMPYCVVSDMDFVDPVSLTNVYAVGITSGINIRPVESVVLKIEYMHAWWPDGYIVSDDPTQVLNTQLAWAF